MIGAILFVYIVQRTIHAKIATQERCCSVNKQSPFAIVSLPILLESFFINLKIQFHAGYEWIPHICYV